MAIRQVKNVIASDLRTRYQDYEVRMLLNKASLLYLRLKSLVHLTEEEQTNTVNDLVNEIIIEFYPFSSVVSEEPVLEDTEPLASSSQVQADQKQTSSETSGEPVRKKCVLEKLLGDTFSSDHLDNSVTVLFNELVQVDLSRYKAEPLLELKCKPLEWWKYHEHSYPKLSHMAKRYLEVVATSVPSERLFSTAGNVITAKRSALDPENVEKLFSYVIIFHLYKIYHINEPTIILLLQVDILNFIITHTRLLCVSSLRSFCKQSLLKYSEGGSQHLCVNCKVTLQYTISVVHEVHVNKNPVNRLTAFQLTGFDFMIRFTALVSSMYYQKVMNQGSPDKIAGVYDFPQYRNVFAKELGV